MWSLGHDVLFKCFSNEKNDDGTCRGIQVGGDDGHTLPRAEKEWRCGFLWRSYYPITSRWGRCMTSRKYFSQKPLPSDSAPTTGVYECLFTCSSYSKWHLCLQYLRIINNISTRYAILGPQIGRPLCAQPVVVQIFMDKACNSLPPDNLKSTRRTAKHSGRWLPYTHDNYLQVLTVWQAWVRDSKRP